MAIPTFSVILKKTLLLSPHVKHFIFEYDKKKPFHFTPGQFITMAISHEGKILKRSYSIANRNVNNTIEFAAGFIDEGLASNILFHLKPGDTIDISGPFGKLILKESHYQKIFLIGTSTGVVPYRAMLNQLNTLLLENKQLSIFFLQGVRQPQDALYRDEFLAFANMHTNVQFHLYYSRLKDSSALSSHEHSGYLQQGFETFPLSPDNTQIFLCGNPTMIDDAFTRLKEMGFNNKQIIREKYISSK